MEKEEIIKILLSKKVYDPGIPEIAPFQLSRIEMVYEFNKIPSSLEGVALRRAKLKEMFASFGENCYIEPPLHANFGGLNVHFGNNIYSNSNLTLVDDGEIIIEDNVMIGPNVTIATAQHPISTKLREKGLQYNLPVHIKRNVWLGSGVIVLPGVTIGENSIIGAGSVVTKDIPANVIAVGNPCKVLREITEEDDKYIHGKLIEII